MDDAERATGDEGQASRTWGPESSVNSPPQSPRRKPLPPPYQNIQQAAIGKRTLPLDVLREREVSGDHHCNGEARRSSFDVGDDAAMRGELEAEPVQHTMKERVSVLPQETSATQTSLPYRPHIQMEGPINIQEPQSAVFVNRGQSPDSAPSSRRVSGRISNGGHSRTTSRGSLGSITEHAEVSQPLHYHHHQQLDRHSPPSRLIGSRRVRPQFHSSISESGPSVPAYNERRPLSTHLTPTDPARLGPGLHRPSSAYSSGSELSAGRTRSPQFSPNR